MSQVTSDTKFMKKLKKFLKIKPRVKNINYNAKTGTKTPNKKFASFREDNKENQKLQQEAKDPTQNIRTYTRVTSKNKDKYSNQHTKKNDKKKTTNNSKLKVGSGRKSIREKNEARFGKAHVDKLRQKNKDFQAMKKKKMTKAEFIKKYPNSQTAKKAR